MNEGNRKIIYLVMCLNYLNELIDQAEQNVRRTPVQIERIRRWRQVRRALIHDVEQERQRLPSGTQIMFGGFLEDGEMAYRWYVRQAADYQNPNDNDPLTQRAEGTSTPSGKER